MYFFQIDTHFSSLSDEDEIIAKLWKIYLTKENNEVRRERPTNINMAKIIIEDFLRTQNPLEQLRKPLPTVYNCKWVVASVHLNRFAARIFLRLRWHPEEWILWDNVKVYETIGEKVLDGIIKHSIRLSSPQTERSVFLF